MIFYIFGLIGLEMFCEKTYPYNEGSPYITEPYTDYSTFMGSQLILLQVMLEANWSNYIYDYAYKYDNFIAAAFYFNIFHMIVQLILLSLIKGIVWEVFYAVHNTEDNDLDEDYEETIK